MIVYCITNMLNNKKYVGYTSETLAQRWHLHKFKAKAKKRPGLLHKAINKYGAENFARTILYEGKDALSKEDYYIKKYGDYNVAHGGSANVKGLTWKWSEESKRRAKERGLMGKADRYGSKNPFYGKTHTQETRNKISEKKIRNI